MNGYDDGSFRPNANVTRAECAQILSNINPEWRAEIIYYDVDSSKWYRNVVSHYGTYMGGTYTDTKAYYAFWLSGILLPEQSLYA